MSAVVKALFAIRTWKQAAIIVCVAWSLVLSSVAYQQQTRLLEVLLAERAA